jgi:ATP-dependent protease ClpP protease subunit
VKEWGIQIKYPGKTITEPVGDEGLTDLIMGEYNVAHPLRDGEMAIGTLKVRLEAPRESESISVDGAIDKDMRKAFCGQLNMAAAIATGGDVNILVTSHGGAVDELIFMINEMDRVRKVYDVRVNTIAEGYAYSGGGILVALGDKRAATPNSSIMIHDFQVGEMGNQLSVSRETSIHFRRQQRFLEKRMSERMGRPVPEIRGLWNKFLNPQQALKEGIIDQVIVYERKTI